MSRAWEGKVATWEPKVGDVIERCLTMRRGRVLARDGDLLWVATTGEAVPETWHINHCRPVSLTLLEAAGALIEVVEPYGHQQSFRPEWNAFIAAYKRAKEEVEES